jgi:hypothetical protein
MKTEKKKKPLDYFGSHQTMQMNDFTETAQFSPDN